jgi:hypothetical protein
LSTVGLAIVCFACAVFRIPLLLLASLNPPFAKMQKMGRSVSRESDAGIGRLEGHPPGYIYWAANPCAFRFASSAFASRMRPP